MTDLERKVKQLPIAWQEFWYERSGIYIDSGMTQPEADKAAWDELQLMVKQAADAAVGVKP